MTQFDYYIFLAVLIVLDVIALYSYFFWHEAKNFDIVQDHKVKPTLKKTMAIQAIVLILAELYLYFHSNNQTWLNSINFLPFIGLSFGFGIIALIEKFNNFLKYFVGLIELSALIGFIFLFPENKIFNETRFTPEVFKVILGLSWFILFKFTCVLNKLEGFIGTQAVHIGSSFLLIFVFFSFPYICILQNGIILFALILMAAPFYSVLRYDLPFGLFARNIFALTTTGLSLFMFLNGYWGIAVLMQMYVFFEIIVFITRLVQKPFIRKDFPLFFFQTLLSKDASERLVVSFIIRRNIFSMALILFIVFVGPQSQAVLLGALLYLKLYLKVMNPNAKKVTIRDIFKQAKIDAQKTFKETNKAIDKIKSSYQNKEEENINE